MKTKAKKITQKSAGEKSRRLVEAIFRCKWSLTVYDLISNGVNRPGAMVRSVEGLSTKVLNQCLRRNIEFGILEKTEFPEVPPRVEYSVTKFGEKFISVLDEIEKLEDEIKK